MSPWFIVAQVLGAVVICFEFASYQIKDKRRYLLVNGIGSALWAVMFIAMGLATTMSTQLNLAIVGAYSSIRALVFWWIFAKDTPKRRLYARIFLGIMIAIALSAGIFLIVTELPTIETQILQAITLIFALGFVIGQYLPGKHPVRITVFLYAVMLFLNQTPLAILDGEGIERWNIMGMLIEAAKMASVLVFYFFILQKGFLKQKLAKIKTIVSCELNKITSDSEISVIADTGIMKLNELERLVAKMLRLELATIDKAEITSVASAQAQTQSVLDDLQTVHDVKMILEKVIKLKMRKLEEKPSWQKMAT